jgi:hypothetical protein
MDRQGRVHWRTTLTGSFRNYLPEQLQPGFPKDINTPMPTRRPPGGNGNEAFIGLVKGDLWVHAAQAADWPFPSSAALLDYDTGEILAGVVGKTDRLDPL